MADTSLTEATAQVADALYTHGFYPVGILTPTEGDTSPAVLASWNGTRLSVTVEILAASHE